MAIDVYPAGSKVLRPRGREGHWKGDGADDEIEIPFPFALSDGYNALQTIAALTLERDDAYPMLVGTPHQAGLLFELHRSVAPPRPASMLSRMTAAIGGARPTSGAALAVDPLGDAARFDVRAWFNERRRADGIPADIAIAPITDDEDAIPPRGEWPDGVLPARNPAALMVMDYERKELITAPVLIIALLPGDDPTTAAAHLGFGGWNACPPTHIHVALARHWRDRFGAKPLAFTSDVIEFEIARPIADRATAYDVALEHYLYCGDNVDQGVGTIDALAAYLVGARYWSFWWD